MFSSPVLAAMFAFVIKACTEHPREPICIPLGPYPPALQ